jgi:hypothetical protein
VPAGYISDLLPGSLRDPAMPPQVRARIGQALAAEAASRQARWPGLRGARPAAGPDAWPTPARHYRGSVRTEPGA